MPQPPAPTFTPEELVEKAALVIKNARFPMLATLDGNQPRLRPVSPVRVNGFTIHIANLRAYGKTSEIAACPNVEVCYLDDQHDQTRITGTATIETDPAVLQSIWDENPLLRKYLGSLSNPDLIIYKVSPSRVRFMKEWALNYHEVPLPPLGTDPSPVQNDR
jgi:general stress protein 26